MIGGHERGGVMLDRLEHLLPIPTGAKMDRWRKNGDTEDREEKKDEVKGEERRQKCTRDIFVHHVHRQSE